MTSSATCSANDALLELADAAGGNLLGVDTSGPLSALCLVLPGERQVREMNLAAHALTAERLADTIAQELRTGTGTQPCAAFVVGLGPGSFTGLRVSLALIKGMALARSTPIYGVSSLEVIAASECAGDVLVAIDARRNAYYTALYRVAADGTTQTIVPDAARTLASCTTLPAPTHIVGDAARALTAACHWRATINDQPMPRMAFGILQAGARMRARQADDLMTLVPRYLRASAPEQHG